MLVLTRRLQQSIVIGEDIVVTVLEVRGDQVRLGISAPRDVNVHREEVYLDLQQANKAAASPPAAALGALSALAGHKPGGKPAAGKTPPRPGPARS